MKIVCRACWRLKVIGYNDHSEHDSARQCCDHDRNAQQSHLGTTSVLRLLLLDASAAAAEQASFVGAITGRLHAEAGVQSDSLVRGKSQAISVWSTS